MEPIINPWLIYALQICDTLKGVFGTTAVLSGIVLLIAIIMYCFLIHEYDEDDKDAILMKKIKRISAIVFVPALVLAILVPSKETATWMVVSSYVTEDNINAVAGGTKEAVDYIFEKIEGLTDESAK